ncbi:MAG: hypothetical protein HOJ22_10115 [Chloroflexi bacterium]|jgi:hypothetical protein|nr:hypothetical protein [Chloroflexota bacterium]
MSDMATLITAISGLVVAVGALIVSVGIYYLIVRLGRSLDGIAQENEK